MSLSLPPGVAAAAPDRGRAPSIATLLLLAAFCWAAVIVWMQSSAMMDAMPGRATLSGAALFAGMWLLMMAAMMLPAITPVVLLFRTMQRGRGTAGRPAVPVAVFVAGYLVVWALAGIVADGAYLAARAAADRLQAGSGAIPLIGGAILVLAGIYQCSPLKHVCLSHCRSPFHFMLHGWHEGRQGALRMGAAHGLYCLGCCWGIMAVLFVVGLMNLAWMAALSALIVVEKLAPWGAPIGRLIGVLFIALGLFMAARPQLFPAAGLQPAGTMAMAMGASMSRMTPAASMGTHHASIGTHRYAATAGPYMLAITMQAHVRFTVIVTSGDMGMAVDGARVMLRFGGMGAPAGPMVAPALGAAHAGQYSTTVGQMSGAYITGISIDGRLARVHIPLS